MLGLSYIMLYVSFQSVDLMALVALLRRLALKMFECSMDVPIQVRFSSNESLSFGRLRFSIGDGFSVPIVFQMGPFKSKVRKL